MIKTAFRIVKLTEIPNFGAIVVDIWPNGELVSIILSRHDTRVFAYFNQCPHAGWPLENFNGAFIFTEDKHLVCAAHGAVFNVTNGHCLGGPGRISPLRPYPIIVKGNEITLGNESYGKVN